MRRNLLFIVLILWCVLPIELRAQVSVSSDNAPPDNSAMLDIRSDSRGLLVPRMTTIQRNNISAPATGLLIFNTDNSQYYYNKGTPVAPDWLMMSTQWINNGLDLYYSLGKVGIGSASVPSLTLQVNGRIGAQFGSSTSPSYTFSDGTEATGFSSPSAYSIGFIIQGTERARMNSAGALGIGTVSPAASAIFDISSTSKGLLPPRMTTAQMLAISAPAEGLTIYNTTLKTLCWFDGTDWVHDHDGASCGTIVYGGVTYKTVVIGWQCWMASNLNIGTRIDVSTAQTNNSTIEKYCFDNNSGNCFDYGGLYQWNEMMNYTSSSNTNPSGRQGICPEGWHIPSNEEWCQFEKYIDKSQLTDCNSSTGYWGVDRGGKVKEPSTARWLTPNTGATNSTGFTAVGSGIVSSTTSIGKKEISYFWTSSIWAGTEAWYRQLSYDQAGMGRNYAFSTGDAYSVRCVKDF